MADWNDNRRVMRVVLCEDESDGNNHRTTEIWNFTTVLV
jgi:hypothetical protein